MIDERKVTFCVRVSNLTIMETKGPSTICYWEKKRWPDGKKLIVVVKINCDVVLMSSGDA